MKRVIVSAHIHTKVSNIFCSSMNRSAQNSIDTTSTGMSYMDSYLDPSLESYLRDRKNRISHIDQMTPKEYYEACAKVFNTSVEDLIKQRRADEESMDYLRNQLEKGRKFRLPYVNFADLGQEGLHRMLVLADKYGWDDAVFPVLVIECADEIIEVANDAKQTLQKCIDKSIEYRYNKDNLPDDFLTEVQWQLDEAEEYTEVHYSVKLLRETPTDYILTLFDFENSVKVEVSKDTIQIREGDTEDFDISDDDIDIDDLDIDALLK